MRRAMFAAVLALAAACGGNPTGATTVTQASVRDFQFLPASLTIKAGTEVRWTNFGNAPHTVTSDNALFSSGNLAAPSGGGTYGGATSGGTFTHMFATAGTFPYHCSNYPAMTGTVTVTP